jgi:MYXO-CTERM domain-containing protein
MTSQKLVRYAAVTAVGLLFSANVALAGPTYTFTTSTGVQPSDVGIITLTQVNATTVDVLVNLADTALPLPQYGFLNTGGPHTPFAFTIAGTETGVSATFIQPTGGSFCPGNATCPPTKFDLLTLQTSGTSDATPFGTFGIGVDSSAGNGSSNAYYGDLEFQLTRAGALSTDDFITNSAISPGDNAYFAADLTDGASNTGSQAWLIRTDPQCSTPPCGREGTPVPEPGSLTVLGGGLTGLGGLLGFLRLRRRRDDDCNALAS